MVLSLRLQLSYRKSNILSGKISQIFSYLLHNKINSEYIPLKHVLFGGKIPAKFGIIL